MHFHFMTYAYGYGLAQETLVGGNEIYNFGRPSLGRHYYILSFSYLYPRVEKSIL